MGIHFFKEAVDQATLAPLHLLAPTVNNKVNPLKILQQRFTYLSSCGYFLQA